MLKSRPPCFWYKCFEGVETRWKTRRALTKARWGMAWLEFNYAFWVASTKLLRGGGEINGQLIRSVNKCTDSSSLPFRGKRMENLSTAIGLSGQWKPWYVAGWVSATLNSHVLRNIVANLLEGTLRVRKL